MVTKVRTIVVTDKDIVGGILITTFITELDGKRDRYESVVKLSRDLIIECKRIIFLMHRITVMATPSMKKKLLDEANCRLTAARNKFLLQIAKALDGSDHYLYLKSYDWALEEFIEACAFYKFLVSRELLLYDEVVSKLQFNDCAETSTQNLYLTLPEVTYLMGLFDIGGELMRFAISEASSGDYQIVQEVTNYLRSLHECYQYLGNVPQNADWAKKSSVFRTSLVKVYSCCRNSSSDFA
ncbi:unnamed protein product [Thelazia callipaeda]|uniref:Translin-associated protein X n=1 Tax=Thelazia callipaeda TaxID=103827 RepID=A0A0N5CUF4_THECL|nr:unnamed protein product [Thelazia callipaeda]